MNWTDKVKEFIWEDIEGYKKSYAKFKDNPEEFRSMYYELLKNKKIIEKNQDDFGYSIFMAIMNEGSSFNELSDYALEMFKNRYSPRRMFFRKIGIGILIIGGISIFPFWLIDLIDTIISLFV